MKKKLIYLLILSSLVCISCKQDEVAIEKTEAEKLGDELRNLTQDPKIKEVEAYLGASLLVTENAYGTEVNGQYFRMKTYRFDLNKLIFYQIRGGDSTLMLAF